MSATLDAKIDLNEFYKVAREDIKSLIGAAAVNASVIFNDTSQPVTFFVYNYIDTVHWVSAQKVLVAPQSHGTVAASGAFFKIHPNDHKSEEFLVAPHKAYVYSGPGNVKPV